MLTYEEGTKLAKEMFVLSSFEDFPFSQIIEVLQSADDLYSNDGESFLTDEQYDTLKRYAHGLEPGNVYFTGIGSGVRGSKVKLPFKMGSLTQVYEGETEEWIAKYNLDDDQVVVTEKLDGVSVLVVYNEKGKLQIAYSRGDGLEGADVTRHISKMKSVPQTVKNMTVVRAEAIISKKSFKKVQPLAKSRSGKPYKNARNMMAGVMNASENDEVVYKFIDVVGYEVIRPAGIPKRQQLKLLAENGFITPKFCSAPGKWFNDEKLAGILEEYRDDSNYEIDGLVLDVDNAERRQKINPTKDTLNPEYARKFKIADASNLAIATVKEVQWNVSKDGYLKPRVKIEPVELVGVTVQHATGFNAKFIKDNKIGPGAKIKITRSGDVIPFILGVEKPAKAQMPTEDAEWTKTGVDLVLKNAGDNKTVKFEQLNDFFASIDAPNLREGNLKKIFDAGFETPEEIIELTQEDFASLLGSQVMGKKVFTGLREKLTNIPLYVLMGSHPAFGRGVGVRKMKKLYEAFEGRMEMCKSVPNITQVEGFDHKTASKVANGWPAFVKFRERTKKYIKVAAYEAKKTGSLSGSSFCFTGFRSKELEAAIEELGGKVSSSVSSKLTYLVAEDKDSTSGKAKKARELGVKVIGPEELRQLVGA